MIWLALLTQKGNFGGGVRVQRGQALLPDVCGDQGGQAQAKARIGAQVKREIWRGGLAWIKARLTVKAHGAHHGEAKHFGRYFDALGEILPGKNQAAAFRAKFNQRRARNVAVIDHLAKIMGRFVQRKARIGVYAQAQPFWQICHARPQAASGPAPKKLVYRERLSASLRKRMKL